MFGTVAAVAVAALLLATPVQGDVFNVKTYGAVGDGVANDTAALQACFDAAASSSAKSPSTAIVIPAGRYLSWPLQLKKATNTVVSFAANATIVAAPYASWPADPKAWPYGGIFWSIKYGSNITITGADQFATIVDGQGAAWWAAFQANGSISRPFLVQFEDIAPLRLLDAGLKDSPMFHCVFQGCNDTVVDSVSISSPDGTVAPNTDGFDPGDCDGMTFTNLYIVNGDDCVAIKPGTANVVIQQSYCENGHGFSIGSLGEHGAVSSVENILVQNVVLNGTMGAAKVKAWQGGRGYARNITYVNVTVIDTIDTPLQVTQFYCPGDPSACNPQPGGVAITEFTVTGMTGTFAHGIAGQFNCTADAPCTDIALADISLAPSPGTNLPNVMACSNAHGTAVNTSPQACLQSLD